MFIGVVEINRVLRQSRKFWRSVKGLTQARTNALVLVEGLGEDRNRGGCTKPSSRVSRIGKIAWRIEIGFQTLVPVGDP